MMSSIVFATEIVSPNGQRLDGNDDGAGGDNFVTLVTLS